MAPRRRESFAERRERRAAVDDPAVVLEAAARFLEVRSRSVAEVRRRLTTAGYRSELVEDAIARLTDLGMLDDEAFARAWVESRDRARPRGERALAEELRVRGVGREIVRATLEDRRSSALDDDGDEPAEASSADEAAAIRLIDRNRRALDRVTDPRARRQRAYGLLARNGFAPDICGRVAARAVETSEADEDDGAGE
jgi:regulatory protein